LLWPALRAVREIGDSGTIEEIVEKVTEIEYRLAWARTYLKGMGALINSPRGVWSTTELGRTMTEDQVARRHADYVADLRAARREKVKAATDDDDAAIPTPTPTMPASPPSATERRNSLRSSWRSCPTSSSGSPAGCFARPGSSTRP
jgi:restriction system protein